MTKKYTGEELKNKFDKVIFEIAINMKPVRKAIKGIISAERFYEYLEEDDANAKRYARACDERQIGLFESMLDIAGNRTEKGRKRKDTTVKVQRDRLEIDTIKWHLSKLAPEKYGDKVDITSKGESLKKNLADESTEDLLARAAAVRELGKGNDKA